MKKTIKLPLIYFLAFLGITFLSSCEDQCEQESVYYLYQPIFETVEVIRESVEIKEPRPINNLGKIYFKDGYLYLNEVDKGIHVIDNREPANPQKIAFINIPGNFSLAAKDHVLYANSYMDLLSFDISNPNDIKEIDRLEEVFMNYSYYSSSFYQNERQVVVDWEFVEERTIRELDCKNAYGHDGMVIDGMYAFSSMSEARVTGNGSGTGVGTGGSMATFTIYDEFLYGIDNDNIILANISNVEMPALHSKIRVGWGIETLFPYGDKLFIGANDGMYIYDNEEPSNPQLISKYQHINSCDPVVVQGDYAYVTLRSGTQCQGFSNQLEVVDISDLQTPTLVKEYPMYNPHGLGIDGNALFICDGQAGLKIYNAENINQISNNLIKQYRNINPIDVIPLGNVLMMISEQGLHQYDYSNLEDIKLISSILIEEPNVEQ
jgi:hypothetical protein